MTSVETLQCGTVEKLLTDAQQQCQSSDVPAVSFMTPLLLKGEDGEHVLTQAGLLGPQTPSDALQCLKQAPLLEDLASWSHWELVFAPYLGELAGFLSTHAKGSVYALELFSGRLLRIEPDSSVPDFTRAVKATNPVDTAGHLVSMVAKAGSVHEVPTQLLANHVKTKLEELATSTSSGGEQPEDYDAAVHFVFSCLTRIPLQMCRILAPEVSMYPALPY